MIMVGAGFVLLLIGVSALDSQVIAIPITMVIVGMALMAVGGCRIEKQNSDIYFDIHGVGNITDSNGRRRNERNENLQKCV